MILDFVFNPAVINYILKDRLLLLLLIYYMTLTLLLNCFQINFWTDCNVSYGVTLPFTYYLLILNWASMFLAVRVQRWDRKLMPPRGSVVWERCTVQQLKDSRIWWVPQEHYKSERFNSGGVKEWTWRVHRHLLDNEKRTFYKRKEQVWY